MTQPLENILTVQGAGGHIVPYEGYVEVNMELPFTRGTRMTALMLVVPDTVYHGRVPILLGTNVLCQFKESNIQDPTWKAVLAMLAKQQAVTNATDSLGSLTIHKPLTIPPNGRMVVFGHTRVQAICQRMSICLDGNNGLPKGVIATPCVSTLQPGRKRSKLPIELVNHSSQPVTIPAKARVCDLYSTEDVTPLEQDTGNMGTKEDSFLSNFKGMKDNLTESQAQEVQSILLKWKNVFSLHDMDLGLTGHVEHRIRLTDDVPFKEKPRSIPPSMFDEVRAHLKEMESLGVIRKS